MSFLQLKKLKIPVRRIIEKMNPGESTQVAKSTPDHCAFCFDVVSGIVNKKFGKREYPPIPESVPNIVAPLFVTWHKDGDLRGCIGTFAKESIAKNLPQYAAVSAFEDHRFDPISKDELPRLSCAVSLLTDFEKGNDAYDWEVGKHGITIEARQNGIPYRGTFLPEVAKEQGWSKEETLKYLVRKAGYHGSLADIVDKIQLERYQSSKCEISYNDYLNMRKST